MLVSDWLQLAMKKLKAPGIATARLDTLILLEDATNKERGWLLAHPNFELTPEQIEILEAQIERRAQHEPLAYIRGKSEFYGREFKVTPATLQPRPETETMVDLFKTLKDVGCIADIGTGSGCIAISIKLESPALEVLATEINGDALEVARVNAKTLEAKVTFYHGNLLEPIIKAGVSPDVLLCNLPYVPDSHTINQAAMQEPKVAIFGGEDGLELYRQLFEQIGQLQTKPLHILTESLPFQHAQLKMIAENSGYTQAYQEDFIQIFSS